MVKRFFRKKYFIPQCQTVSISYLLDSFSDSSVFDFTKQIVSKVQTNNGNGSLFFDLPNQFSKKWQGIEQIMHIVL